MSEAQAKSEAVPPLGPKLILAAFAGVLYFLGFVGFDIFPLTWFCFVPVLFSIRDVTPKRALLIGTVFGVVTNMGGYYWVINLLQEFADLNLALAGLGYFLLCLYQGFLLAIVIWLVRRAEDRLKIAPIWSLAVAFPALEFFYPLLFPSYIGNSQYRFSHITQFVDLTGMLGLTILIALVNGAIYELTEAYIAKRRPQVRPLAVAGGAFAAALIYGAIRLPMIEQRIEKAATIDVALIQTNIGAKEKHARAEDFIRLHQTMSIEALQKHPELDLLVWPESAYNEWIARDVKNLRQVTKPLDRPLIFGALTYTKKTSGPREIYNTAVLTSSTGDVLGLFDKVELLAFGETIPLIETFPSIRGWFPHTGLFTRGKSFRNFEVPGGTSLLPMICYEDILPAFVRKMWKLGGPSDALVNVTNDSWYGDTHEPLIHLVLASFRSIETRRALIRSTNTGISAIVDPAGRIVARTGQWTKEILVAKVPLIEDGSSTVYMMIGDVLGWAAGLAALAGLIASRRRVETTAKPKSRKR